MRWLAIICALWASSAHAQSATEAATRAASQLDIASALLEAAETRSDRVTALTETITAYEAGLAAMRDGLRQVAVQEQALTAQLEARRTEIAQLLGVLQAMGRAPAPLLLLHPNGAVGTARGGMVAADVTPALQARAAALRTELDDIAALQAIQEGAADTLAEGLAGAQAARTALSAAISNRTDLPRRFAEDPAQTALLIDSAETLDAFASGLTDSVLETAPDGTTASATGDSPLPVQGVLLRRFNAPDAAGVVRPGVILAAHPRAIVTNPVPATLLFRGPLLNYGNVVILEPTTDVMFVIAGLGEVYGTPGEVLPAGTPLGLMPGTPPEAHEFLTEWDGQPPPSANETLYLEVRDGQSPVDPATWFALE